MNTQQTTELENEKITPCPLERRVGRGTRKERLLAFALAFRSWLLNILYLLTSPIRWSVNLWLFKVWIWERNLFIAARTNIRLDGDRMIRQAEYFLLSLVVAMATKPMHWFGDLGIFFQRESENLGGNLLQVIPLSLCIPSFEVSSFFFQICFISNQRRYVLLQRKNDAMQGVDFTLQNIQLSNAYGIFGNLKQCLNDIRCMVKRGECRGRNRNRISHQLNTMIIQLKEINKSAAPNARAKGRGRADVGETHETQPRVPLSAGLGGGLEKSGSCSLLFALFVGLHGCRARR